MTHKAFWKTIQKPIIGLAPMDGYSDSAFRQVCKKVNPNLLTYTEFTSADGLSYNAKTVQKKLRFLASERPILAQIFGKNIETFIRATKLCEDMGFTGIDLNMGCPAKKVVKSEHGVALRKNVDLACQLIDAVASNTKLPVSVKTRLGWSDASDLIDFGLAAQNAGADMIAIHARTYQEPYKVAAQFEPVYALKEALSIPVLGNGGITSLKDGLDKLGNLDGFLIGQASFGNPWVFDPLSKKIPLKDQVPIIHFHAKALLEHKGDLVGAREMRKHLLKYFKGFTGAKRLRQQMSRVENLADIETVLEEIKHSAYHETANTALHSQKNILIYT